MENDAYTYSIDSNKQMIICYYLNQNNVWERAANIMGYSAVDIIVSVLQILSFFTLKIVMRHFIVALYHLLENQTTLSG